MSAPDASSAIVTTLGDPRRLVSDNVYTIYGDRSGQMWLGLEGGISRFDPATDGFVDHPVPDNPASLASLGRRYGKTSKTAHKGKGAGVHSATTSRTD